MTHISWSRGALDSLSRAVRYATCRTYCGRTVSLTAIRQPAGPDRATCPLCRAKLAADLRGERAAVRALQAAYPAPYDFAPGCAGRLRARRAALLSEPEQRLARAIFGEDR